MQELKRHGQMEFEVEFILMDPGYSEEHLGLIAKNIEILNIPVHIFKTDIFKVVYQLDQGSPCYICARMRRGHLYNQAKELGCNKIALGHHFDDVIETILLSMLYGGEIKTMMPKLHSDNFSGLELIRPLYLVEEENIMAWAKYSELTFLNCACYFTEDELSDSKRLEMKELVKQFQKTNPYIKMNIFKSVENVNLNAVIGYHREKEQFNFLDGYDKQG